MAIPLLFALSAARAAEPAPALLSLAGATCFAEPRTDIDADPAAPAPVNVRCANTRAPTGSVVLTPAPLSLPADSAARHAVLEKVAASTPAGQSAAQRMACRAGRWLRVGEDQDVWVRPCALIDGDWPSLLVVAHVGAYLVQTEGLPVLLPVLGRLASDGTGADSGFAGPEPARQILDAAYDGHPPLVSSVEVDAYGQLVETARLQATRDDYRAVEDAYRQALLIQEKAQGPDAPGVGATLMELGLAVSNQRRGEEAAALFRRADAIVQRSPDPADQARYYTYMAYDAANGGRFTDGLSYARQASATWRDLSEAKGPDFSALGATSDSSAPMRGELAHSLGLQAAMALKTGDLAEAEASAKEALTIVGEVSGLPPMWRPEILVTLGKVYAALGQLNEAEEAFRGALVYQQRLFGDTAPTAVTLLALSAIYSNEGLYGDSVRAYDVAAKILQDDELARSHVVFDQVAPMIASASALMDRDPAQHGAMEERIFRGLQMLSYGVADQTIAKATVRLASGDPAIEALVRGAQEAERLRDQARIELAYQTSLPDEDRGATKETQLLADVNRYAKQSVDLLNRINHEFPAYAVLSRPPVIDLAVVQRRLDAHEALLMFAIAHADAPAAKSFAVLVTPHKLVARVLDTDPERLSAQVRELRKAFDLKGGKLQDFDLGAAYALYQTLFGPIEDDLADVNRIAVVSDGALASLPLGLLVTKAPVSNGRDATTDYRHAAWLARRFATADAPSIRAFLALRDRAGQKQAPYPFLGIGNPLFTGAGGTGGQQGLTALSSSCRDGGPIAPQTLRALEPLPETAGELRAVAKALGADDSSLLLGAAATEAAFRKLPLGDARVLYFATHGLLPGELSCQSEPALALSPPAEPATGRDADGLLDASEIAGLRLNADLVVLSACNTAQSPTRFGGEALSGLADAFFYAGARGLIASHWEVPSAATANLMVGLFQREAADSTLSTAEALRLSQLALIDRDTTAHPFFWAAFTVIGDGGGTPPPSQAAIASAPSSKM